MATKGKKVYDLEEELRFADRLGPEALERIGDFLLTRTIPCLPDELRETIGLIFYELARRSAERISEQSSPQP